jgi:hypothetical protein
MVSAMQKLLAKMLMEYWLTFVKQCGENDDIKNKNFIGPSI